jgi:hypothetical protein
MTFHADPDLAPELDVDRTTARSDHFFRRRLDDFALQELPSTHHQAHIGARARWENHTLTLMLRPARKKEQGWTVNGPFRLLLALFLLRQ